MKTSSGYIGLIALLIGTLIVVYLAVQQYSNLATKNSNRQAEINTDSSGQSVIMHPIDRALDVKTKAEARDRALLGQ